MLGRLDQWGTRAQKIVRNSFVQRRFIVELETTARRRPARATLFHLRAFSSHRE